VPAVEELVTPRLRLRRWRPEDEAAMAAINADPEVTRYLNRPVGAAATAGFYAAVAEHWGEHGFGFWAVELREPEAGPAAPVAEPAAEPAPGAEPAAEPAPGAAPAAEPARCIGFAGVAYPTFLPELAGRPELGWRLARRAWGRGLATEAATAARDHAFATLGLPALISIIHPQNARSRRVATKLGMTLAEHVHVPALHRDADVWRLGAPRAQPGLVE
jgi:RimJ/RimL family protein N-acetyltransferase